MAKGLLHEIINPVNSSSQALSYAKSINQDEDIGEEALHRHGLRVLSLDEFTR